MGMLRLADGSRVFAALAAGTLVALTGASCSSARSAESSGGAFASSEMGLRERPVRQAASPYREDSPIASLLATVEPEVVAYHQHVTTFSNPFFEGRAPGTRGGDLAAEYLEFHFRRAGLEPAFRPESAAPGGATRAAAAYVQDFDVPGETVVNVAELSWDVGGGPVALEHGEEFNPLGVSASDAVEGELAFVGYSVESGPDGYSSYPHGEELDGAVALALRFEPMDSTGRSAWAESGRWSNNAALVPKIAAAFDHGASAVILVNAPGADDPRAEELMDAESRFGRTFPGPVVMMSQDAADDLVRAADPQGRSLRRLRRLADRGEIGVLRFGDALVDVEVDLERRRIETRNVGAALPGVGDLADEYLVIGAHYDHVGYGYYGSRGRNAAGTIHPGADDNASGTIGLLVLAERLKEAYRRLPEDAAARSLLFLAFGAEEMGLIGSREYMENPSVAPEDIAAMINMDMIGRLRDEELTVNGVGTAAEFEEILDPHFAQSGLQIEANASGEAPTDHTNFYREGVPVLAFFTGLHAEYHTPRDVPSTVHSQGAMRVLDLVGDVALELATRRDRLTFQRTESPRRAGRLRNVSVRLGIAPGNYADTEPGVVVGSVSEGTSAEEGGLQAGDRIIRWNGEELADVMAMMERLAEHSPGDEVVLVVRREGEEVTLPITLKARGGDD